MTQFVEVTMLLTMQVPLDETGKLLLPDNLTVGGDLDLGGAPVTALPDNLTVMGDLDLRSTPMISMPVNLTVGGDLFILEDFEEIPASAMVGGRIHRE